MTTPEFFEVDADSMIRTNGLHWEGFLRLAWEALSTSGYPTPPLYEVLEFVDLGVPRCRVTVTVPPHPDHPDWADLSSVFFGLRGQESIESAALRVLTDFCDHNPTEVVLSPFGLFPAVDPQNLTWQDHVDHLEELLLLATPLDIMQTLTRCLDALYTLQAVHHTTEAILGLRLETTYAAWHELFAAYQ